MIRKGDRLILTSGLDCVVINPPDDEGNFEAIDKANLLGKRTYNMQEIKSIEPTYYHDWPESKDYKSPYSKAY